VELQHAVVLVEALGPLLLDRGVGEDGLARSAYAAAGACHDLDKVVMRLAGSYLLEDPFRVTEAAHDGKGEFLAGDGEFCLADALFTPDGRELVGVELLSRQFLADVAAAPPR